MIEESLQKVEKTKEEVEQAKTLAQSNRETLEKQRRESHFNIDAIQTVITTALSEHPHVGRSPTKKLDGLTMSEDASYIEQKEQDDNLHQEFTDVQQTMMEIEE